MPEQPTTPHEELAAMRKIAETLNRLDEPAGRRTLRWLIEVYRPFDDEPGQQEF